MKLKQRLTYAVMRGLNESFDIEDMDNKISSTSTKEKIDKHSKFYKQIMEFINKRYPLKNAKKCYRMLQPNDIELLEFLYLHRDMLDTDANALVDEYDLSALFVTTYIKGMKDEINDRLKTHKYLTATQ